MTGPGGDAADYARGPKRPDDTPLMKPALRPVPRPAIERLQAVVAQSQDTEEPADPAPRGRRRFRDQPETQPGPRLRRKR